MRDRPRIQDLAGAVLAGGETEDLLDLMLRSARTDLGARSAVLVMPLNREAWGIEMVDGPDAPALLGEQVPAAHPIGVALEQADADALERIGTFALGEESCRVMLAVIDAAEHGTSPCACRPCRPTPRSTTSADGSRAICTTSRSRSCSRSGWSSRGWWTPSAPRT